MSAHTPWTQDGRLIVDARGDAVAMVNIARPVNDAHRDARLIAAAPELLDALREIRGNVGDRSNLAHPQIRRLEQICDDAIAKATGQS